jgi:GTP cyclohydrolase I
MNGLEQHINYMLDYLVPDRDRPGLDETPTRVAKAWQEFTAGYHMDPADVFKVFEDGAEGCDEMVIVHNIPIVSRCEHHLEPIQGIAHIAYIPDGKVVGLSKLPRLCEVYMRRLQVQERLTNQIADAIVEHLAPKGVGVIIRASHGCMCHRGVKIHGSTTTTSALRGVIKEEKSARAEFLQLCTMAEASKCY